MSAAAGRGWELSEEMRRELWEIEQIGAGRNAGGAYVREGYLDGKVAALERFEGQQVAVVCEEGGRFSVVEVGEQPRQVAVGDELVCHLGRDRTRVELRQTKERRQERGDDWDMER